MRILPILCRDSRECFPSFQSSQSLLKLDSWRLSNSSYYSDYKRKITDEPLSIQLKDERHKQIMIQTESPAIAVSVQQTRFHLIEDNASREIDIKGLSLVVASVPGQEEAGDSATTKTKSKSKVNPEGLDLLSNAHLRLKTGVHYALVGRNGCGKSTLLKALADKLIPGIALTVRIAVLQQTHDGETAQDTSGESHNTSTKSVLARVVEGDPYREKVVQKLHVLNQALESNDPLAPVRTHRKLKHARFQTQYAEVKKAAHLRSGARGSEARKVLLAYEAKEKEWDQTLAEGDATIVPTMIESETKDAVDLQADLQAQLDTIPQIEVETNAKKVLTGLGFKEDQFSKPFAKLSGGWRMRCLLAAALVQSADILILDEPTNYLDLLGILWLQSFLAELPPERTLVLVSHDRDFVNGTCAETIILRDQTLIYHEGNLESYDKSVRRETLRLTRMKDAQDKQIEHMEKTIKNSINQGKKSGDDGKLRQAKSRRKKVDERMGMNVSAKGTRFKLNRDMAGYHNHAREDINIPKEERGVDMSFPDPPDLRFPGSLLSLEKVGFTYRKTTKPALSNVDMVIHEGDRIGVIGLNGAGKSTLVRLLVGEAKPSQGTATFHPRVKVGYYSQHAVDALKERSQADRSLTALSMITQSASEAGIDVAGQPARALLGSLGLQGRTVSDTPVSKLSGGQLVRLTLALLFLNPPHVFVLDEPTTHLDLPTVTAMTRALREYRGAIVLVTHDRFFMRCVIEGDPVDADDSEDSGSEDDEMAGSGRRMVYHVKAGTVAVREGGVGSWEAGLEKRLQKLGL